MDPELCGFRYGLGIEKDEGDAYLPRGAEGVGSLPPFILGMIFEFPNVVEILKLFDFEEIQASSVRIVGNT